MIVYSRFKVMAPNIYRVAGAGDTSYNGDYPDIGTYNNAPLFGYNDRRLFWGGSSHPQWYLGTTGYEVGSSSIYYSSASNQTPEEPATTGWGINMGTWPIPTVTKL